MIIICFKIFFARILDVTLGTIRTVCFVKGKIIAPFLIAFFEVIIWFIIAKEALGYAGNTLLIAVFYAGGYATGTFIGAFLSRKLIKVKMLLQIITDNDNEELLKELENFGLKVYTIELKRINNKKNKILYLEINNNEVNNIKNIVYKYDKEALFLLNEIKNIENRQNKKSLI